ncbi:MAG: TonB-dependent receptor [Melioribacter sp.]|uniref:TonB-dependent receptor n=1 Tax=Rosettibacter primus TaxID=3111523 RepID=UPI00247B3887|nr:TonB-dependent receptor [Melioribacter sp.]
MKNKFILMVRLISIAALLMFINMPWDNYAQTKSRIIGTVRDAQTNEPLFGANVIVKGTYLGAATDDNGKFFIVNVPVGTYDIQVSMIGYTSQILTGVIVSADRVTNLEIALQPTVIQGQEVVVTAKRDELHKEVSNTQMVVSSGQLQDASGVREINAFLSKLPGVSTENGFLTIRGGSADQTGSLVNGLSYVNAAVGNAETSIPLSAIDQVSLLSGGYNAEYGNFRSGLINITTKSGSKDGYHGSFSFSRDNSHMRRFGASFYDPRNDALRSYLDASVAFIGTDAAWANNPYMKEQNPKFTGWINQASIYNKGKAPEKQVTPFDLYLFAVWMHMSEPDYEGLANLSPELKQQIGYYELSEEQKRLFKNHRMKEDGSDWNFDGGFGGPIPFIGKYLGDATFYISNNSSERHYVMPLTLRSQKSYTTFATIKSQPVQSLSVTYNALWKRQIGLSPIRPPWGDAPNAGNAGGFMPLDNIRYVYNNPEYWYDPPFYPILNQTILMNGVTINKIISNKTYWELTVGYLHIKNHTPTGDNRDTTFITNFGPIYVDESPYGKWQFATTHKVYNPNTKDYFTFPSYDAPPGMARRFRGKEGDLYDNTKINQLQVKFDLASQIDEHNFIKGGFEYNYIDINHNFWEKWNNNAYNTYEFNYHRWPSQAAAYIQDQISFEGLIANLGVRFDYYNGGGGLWPTGDPFAEEVFRPQKVDTSLYRYLEKGGSYIWDTWLKYNETHPGFLQPVKNFFTISPRIGVSFPVTVNSKFYFNYGHFRSNPPYYTMYLFRYRYDKNGLYDMSNPNLEPPRTISYELGVAYNFLDNYLLQLSGYYKDITGQAGEVNYQTSSGTLNYTGRANNEYQDIQGFEVTLSKNDNSWINFWINFNYMLSKTGLTGKQIISDVTINNDREGLYQGQESRALPRPRLNANITFRSPRDFGPSILGHKILGGWSMTIFGEWRAGDYFTYNPLSKLHISNNMKWPDYYMVDLKLTKSFDIYGLKSTFYVDISNVLNLKVSLLNRRYAFQDNNDFNKYLASLHLPMYDSPEFDQLRQSQPGYYIPGNDKVGDLRSDEKPYINDPNYSFWLYGQPRDIWVGFRIDF